MRTLVSKVSDCIEIACEDGQFVNVIVIGNGRLHFFVRDAQGKLEHCAKGHVFDGLPGRRISIIGILLVMV